MRTESEKFRVNNFSGMEIEVKKFSELSLEELYDVLRVRAEVFVEEQNCPYQDLDGKDQKALHILGKENNQLVAYARCFAPGDYFKEAAFGRVLVLDNYRKLGYGHRITNASIQAIKDNFKTKEIRISAQLYLVTFYESHGFNTIGDRYLEVGIPHISMLLNL